MKQPEQKQGFLGKLLGSKDNKEIETVMDGPFKKPVASPPPKGSGASSRDAELAQLSDMGFTIEVLERLFRVEFMWAYYRVIDCNRCP